MRELGSMLKHFVNKLEYAKYIPLDELFPSLEIRRIRIPPHNSLIISVLFSFKDQFKYFPYMEPHKYFIFSNKVTGRIYWNGENSLSGKIETIPDIGPFSTYEQAAINLDYWLGLQYGIITWWGITEINLDLFDNKEEDK